MHGSDVVVVTSPGEHTGAVADAAVSNMPGCVLAIRTADCAPVVLDGITVVGVVHAGWRGLTAGVIANAVHAMRTLGARQIRATIGPCIRAGCYEFSDDVVLDGVARLIGEEVRATTMWGTRALDLSAGVRAALARPGVNEVVDVGACTACDPARWFSHRARAETERMAAYVWLAP